MCASRLSVCLSVSECLNRVSVCQCVLCLVSLCLSVCDVIGEGIICFRSDKKEFIFLVEDYFFDRP